VPATFVVVPQWQGSGSSRAMRLIDGALAIQGDLPSASTRTVDVPLEAGDAEGSGVQRLSSILMVKERVERELAGITGTAIVIGGDCGVEIGALPHALGEDVAVLWFDAHADLNTPESSPSHAFNGMVLRSLLGDGPAALVPSRPLSPERLVLVGARAFDLAEDEVVAERGIHHIEAADVSAASVIAAVESMGATSVYVHLDFDVIDPVDFAGSGYPEPFGVPAEVLLATLKGVLARFPLAGAAVAEFEPSSVDAAGDDMPTILRIIGALSAAA
jgi:arginase